MCLGLETTSKSILRAPALLFFVEKISWRKEKKILPFSMFSSHTMTIFLGGADEQRKLWQVLLWG